MKEKIKKIKEKIDTIPYQSEVQSICCEDHTNDIDLDLEKYKDLIEKKIKDNNYTIDDVEFAQIEYLYKDNLMCAIVFTDGDEDYPELDYTDLKEEEIDIIFDLINSQSVNDEIQICIENYK